MKVVSSLSFTFLKSLTFHLYPNNTLSPLLQRCVATEIPGTWNFDSTSSPQHQLSNTTILL